MRRTDSNIVEQLRLLGRANEDQYFHRLDQELIAKLRAEAAAQAEEADRLDRVFSRLLVAVDFSSYSRRALGYAADIAGRFGSTVVVLHVIPDAVLEARLTERHPERPLLLAPHHLKEDKLDPAAVIHELREKAYDALRGFLPVALLGQADGQRVELRVLIGEPFERLIESVSTEDADLLILGTHGRTGLSRLVTGSIAERVVRLATCPVLTVKSDE